MESELFAHWLARQEPAGILPHQSRAAVGNANRLSASDLISVLYYTDGEDALTALNRLKHLFNDEMMAMEEMSRLQW